MKKALILTIILFVLACTGLSVSAQNTDPVNAELLLPIWYSNNHPVEGDEIKIFGGFQNHSDKMIEGQAAFFVYCENIFFSTKV